MSKVLKIILGLFGLLVALVLAAVVIIPLVVDPNDYRDDIARAVEEETGRSFEIEGEISLSVFPWLGLEVGRMRLGNLPGFGDGPFAEIGSAGVGAKLMPLLSRRLEVSTLRLDGLRVHLVQLEDGSSNWSDLADGKSDAVAESAPHAAGGEQFRLERIDGLRLTDAVVRYEDRSAGSVVEVAIPRLTTGELAPGKVFPVEAETSLRLDEDGVIIATTLGGSVQVAEDFGAVTIRDLALGFELSGAGVPGGKQSGQLEAPSLTADLDAQTLAIPELAVEAAGLRATADVTGSGIVDAPALSGRVQLQSFSPRALLQRLGEPAPDTADPAVLDKASLEARFQAGTEQVRLDGLQLMLDDTTLAGSAEIGFGQVMRVRSELTLDAIDLDRYLPPEAEEAAEPAPGEDVELAFDWLDNLDLDASFKAGTLKVNGLTLTNLEGRAVARDGVLTLQPFGAALYGGRVGGTARLDARRTPATFSLEQSLSALQLLPFVKDLAGFEKLTGIAQLGAKLSTTASSTADLMSGLNGELSFDVSDGALKGVNLWYEIQRANALARGRAAPERTSPDTDFRQLKGTAVIRDGLLVNQDLVGGLPFLALAGQGQVNLVESALDYRLNATVIREAIDEATGERSELAGATVPLRLRGSLDSPSVSVDLGGLVRDRAQQEALQRLGIEPEEGKTAEDELKERAGDKARRLLDRLRKDD
jgi:AsmA protein